MIRKKRKKTRPPITIEEQKRRKREFIAIAAIILFLPLMTFFQTRFIHFGADFPISNTILMFTLINIEILLLILLLFLVFRNLVKLFYDRKRKVTGARLRTRLVIAFMAQSLLPTTVLFVVAIYFITSSIESWFNVPVEQALENSLLVGRRVYQHVEDNNKFLLKNAAFQIHTNKYLKPQKIKSLNNYVKVVRREFNTHTVEAYDAKTRRLAYSSAPLLDKYALDQIPSDDLHKEPAEDNVWTVSTNIPAGELIRTIGTVPFNADRKTAEGYIVIGILIPYDLSSNMATISRGVEEYRQIKMLKRPIQMIYYIILSIVALLVVFCAVWFGFYIAKSITIPIMELADGTRRVAEGDLSVNIDFMLDDEIGSLVDSFNSMTRDIRMNREKLEHSTRLLHEQNIELDEQRQYMEIILRNVSAGVISLNQAGIVTTINKAAEKMLNIEAANILKKSFRTLLKGQYLKLANETMEEIISSKTGTVEIPLKFTIQGRPRSFMVHLNMLRDDGGNHMGIVMVIDDLTELQKAQRMAAWREVARRIAHEVKNPLTPISLSAQRLKRKYTNTINDKIFDECTRTIIDHVDLIRNLVNEFSTFARFPGAHLKNCDLQPIIEETVALYREGHRNITFETRINGILPQLNLDRQQIKQAMINLVDNAIAAIEEAGKITITLTHDPILGKVRIEVADTGSGIPDNEKIRLFEPYFSTKKTGMGLGLTIVSTIIADHDGLISVQDNNPKGAKFVIEIPEPKV